MDAGRIILRGNSRLLKPAITEILAMYQLIQAQEFPIYGVPITGFQSQFKFKPQVMMYFLQDKSEAQGKDRVAGEISFRLMPYETETITQAYVNQLANIIKTKFATGQPFIWRKGKKLYSYCDDRRGYRLNVLSPDETEAKRVMEQVLDIQGHSPDWKEYFNAHINPQEAAKYPEEPGNQTILGKTVKKPRRRPIINAKFQYALLHIDGLPNPVCLVDASNQFPHALQVA